MLAACSSDGASDVPESTGDELAQPAHIAPGIELAHRRAAPTTATPVERQQASVHYGNAYWLGRLSFLSYSNPTDIRSSLQNWGFDTKNTRIFENTCSGGVAFYVPVGSYAILVFRGTEPNWNDWSTDLTSLKIPWNGAGLVHAGFFERFDSLWSADPGCGMPEGLGSFLASRHAAAALPLYLTGHSMGAALATLALATFQSEACGQSLPCDHGQSITPSALYTYGSPRVGDQVFARATAGIARDHTPIFRFVNSHDLVPAVPTDLNPIEALYSDYLHVSDDGEDEYELEIWVEDKRLEFATSHSLYSLDDHVGYLEPLEFQARVHNQYH